MAQVFCFYHIKVQDKTIEGSQYWLSDSPLMFHIFEIVLLISEIIFLACGLLLINTWLEGRSRNVNSLWRKPG